MQSSTVALPEAVNLYLDELEAAGRTVETIRNYRRILLKFLASTRAAPNDLAVREFLDGIAAINSRSQSLVVVRQWYGFMRRRGLIVADPTAGIPIPKLRRRQYPPVAPDEVDRILEASGRLMRVVTAVLYWTGARVGEIVRIRVEDVRFDHDHGTIDFAHRKGDQPGFAAFGPEVTCHLHPWLVGRSGWAFPHPTKPTHLTRSIVQQRLRQAAIQAGIPGIVSPHRLRHAFITRAVDAGWPQLALQQQVGHASPLSTAWYYRPTHNGLVGLYRRLPP